MDDTHSKPLTKGQQRRNRQKAVRREAEQLAKTYGVSMYALTGRPLVLARKRLQKLLQMYRERFNRFPSAQEIEFEWKVIAGMYVRTK